MHPVHRRFILCVLAVLPAAARAQARDGDALGPFAGVNISSFGGGDAAGSSSRAGLSAGFLAQAPISPHLFVRSGALYGSWGASDQGVTIKLEYIQVPLLLGYRFSGAHAAAYLDGGAVVGFKLSCNVTGGGMSATCANTGGDIAAVDAGVAVGAGLSAPAGRGSLLLDVRYYVGVTRVESSSDLKNLGFTLGVGYLFPLHRHAAASHS